LGIFAIPEVVFSAIRGGATVQDTGKVQLSMRGVIQGMKDVFTSWKLFLRSSVIGWIVGAVPGVGASTAIWVSYAQAKQTSKHPETFGQGNVEGVIAPESANNAKDGGACLCTLALGIPGSGEWVFILAAFLILGITPGPNMLTDRLPLSFSLLQVLFIANIIGAGICLLIAPYLARVALVPARHLVPIISVVIFVGCYTYEEQFFDVVTMLIFGVVGIAMIKYGLSRPALVLGFVLGNLFEQYLLIAWKSSGPLFFLRPISLIVICLTTLVIVWEPLKGVITNWRAKGARA
jgi:putative tricarboxylic transport membrane protein